MQGILNLQRTVSTTLLMAGTLAMISCAHEKDTALVNDQNRKYESTIPWNKQEKWEQEGSGQMSQLMNTR
jgi:hypothetical protein